MLLAGIISEALLHVASFVSEELHNLPGQSITSMSTQLRTVSKPIQINTYMYDQFCMPKLEDYDEIRRLMKLLSPNKSIQMNHFYLRKTPFCRNWSTKLLKDLCYFSGAYM